MKILALEMSTAHGSIAWCEGEETKAEFRFAADRKHSGEFFENLARCRRKFGLPEKIIVGLGPGSYAGVRIAIASAIGLSAMNDAKVSGIPSICALDIATADYGVIGDARRQSFFFARIKDGRLEEGPILESASELQKRIERLPLPIYASERLTQFPTVELAYPCAGRLMEVARSETTTSDDALEPIYLREPHITVAKSGPGFAPTK